MDSLTTQFTKEQQAIAEDFVHVKEFANKNYKIHKNDFEILQTSQSTFRKCGFYSLLSGAAAIAFSYFTKWDHRVKYGIGAACCVTLVSLMYPIAKDEYDAYRAEYYALRYRALRDKVAMRDVTVVGAGELAAKYMSELEMLNLTAPPQLFKLGYFVDKDDTEK